MAFIGNTNITQGFIPAIDYFSGNGSTVAFTLSRPVASVAQVQANISNVPQNPSSAFSVSGNTITFTSAPPSGTNNIYVYYTSPITQVIAPSQGTVGTTQLQNGLVVNFADGSAASPSITNDGNTNTGIFFPAADTIAFSEGGAEAMRIDSSGNLGIGTSSPGFKLVVSKNGAEGIEFVPGGVSNVSTTQYYNRSGAAYTANAQDASYHSWLISGAEKARIDSSGNLLVGATATINARKTLIAYSDVTNNGLAINETTGASATQFQAFFTNGTSCGAITRVGATSAVTYGTSSDYRLKKNILPMVGALEKISALKPCTYTWKDCDVDSQGFIAHELAEVCPDAVVGEKDAVDSEGNPQYQNVDTSFLVATLTAAIQEQQAIITSLTDRITLLENK